ncbi:hypothetical protein KIPB_012486, partial [Kipferlia bialata]
MKLVILVIALLACYVAASDILCNVCV